MVFIEVEISEIEMAIDNLVTVNMGSIPYGIECDGHEQGKGL